MKRISVFLGFLLTIVTALYPGVEGKFEVGFHYSYWSIDIIAPLVEDLTPELKYYDPEKGKINFDSYGNNYGFEFRYFPYGKQGSFSVGLSYERNNFEATAKGSYTDYPGGIKLDASLDGNVQLFPHSFNISIRWEIWPRTKFHPYVGLGFGFGPLNGRADYYVKRTLYTPPNPITEDEYEEYTMQELMDEYEKKEGESFPITFFPIVHLNFGFRGEIGNHFYVLAEFAVYDGLIFRSGLAYRF